MLILENIIDKGELVNGISVGIILTERLNEDIQLWKEQEGNIPAIYRLKLGNYFAEITTLNKVIIGFHLDILKFKNSLRIQIKQNFFDVNTDSSFEEFIKYLNTNNIKWYFETKECVEQRIVICTASKIKFYFLFDAEDWGLFRLSVFDMDLYNSFL